MPQWSTNPHQTWMPKELFLFCFALLLCYCFVVVFPLHYTSNRNFITIFHFFFPKVSFVSSNVKRINILATADCQRWDEGNLWVAKPKRHNLQNGPRATNITLSHPSESWKIRLTCTRGILTTCTSAETCEWMDTFHPCYLKRLAKYTHYQPFPFHVLVWIWVICMLLLFCQWVLQSLQKSHNKISNATGTGVFITRPAKIIIQLKKKKKLNAKPKTPTKSKLNVQPWHV